MITEYAGAVSGVGLLHESRISPFVVETPSKDSQVLKDVPVGEVMESDGRDKDDMVMVEEPSPRNKGKGRTVMVLISAPKKTGGVTKRVLQDSPTKVGPPTVKRVHVVDVAESDRWLDLSVHCVEEFERVTDGQVPGSVGQVHFFVIFFSLHSQGSGQVCDHCKGKKGLSCRLLWGIIKGEKAIQCRPCAKGKKGYSFSKCKWGIAVWLEIETMEEGVQH